MYRWLCRITGFAVCCTFGLILTWGGLQLYQLTYRGEQHFVVMPEGAQQVRPGSIVYYEGMSVGEVMNTQPLLHASPERRQTANDAFIRKFDLLNEPEPLSDRDRNPARKTLVRFLLQHESIPIGSSTYATGSAFYVTGQGYVTLKNRSLTARNGSGPLFIPSSVRYPWFEQYVNMGLSVAPFLNDLSAVHSRFDNWYDRRKPKETSGEVSGRDQLDSIPRVLEKFASVSERINDDLTSFSTPVDDVNRLLESTNSAISDADTGGFDKEFKMINNGDLQSGSSNDLSFMKSMVRNLNSADDSVFQLQEPLNRIQYEWLRDGVLNQ